MKIHELFPYLHVRNAAKAIEFYTRAFGATEKFRLMEPDGKVGHAELDFGGTTVMLADEFPQYGIQGPESHGGTSVTIHLHVDDADEMIRNAVSEGATIENAIQDHPHGERSGSVLDPFGHRWTIGHSIEDVTPEEMQRRYDELCREA